MFFIIGLVVVFASIIAGFLLEGGSIPTLLHPLPAEGIMIFGAAVGAFLASNPPHLIKRVVGDISKPLKGSPYTKAVYMEVLMMQYEVYVNIKKGGLLALEQDVNDPHNSAIFKKYPAFTHNHHALDFFCDSMKLLINGSAKMDEIDLVMDADLDVHHAENAAPGAAVGTMADAFPAFGIVACVMGIVITMGFLDQPPNVIGSKVGAALVGTFLGILLAYGVFQPLSKNIDAVNTAESFYFNCMRAGLTSFGNGAAPVTAVEFARRNIPSTERPGSGELEEVVRQIKPR
ncbi:flagellar motor stator protein MotA [Geothrix oryzae]|uniref:Flagellar motor stator protein MotA n=1 Tax=Geothrix oryzae TaxID=2927975 RepID=A0ABN6UU52_9BACT|nr:flagellar motor stator protein MotA [Geothrix oryzae]BDU68279.1 flagellar motor stator protein MotA [Geothrix oryzae]